MNWEDHRKELLKDPKVRQALKEVEPEYVIARQIILTRLKKHMTQKTLAQKLKTKQSVISRVESGNHLPSLSFLHRLATAMGTNLTVTFGN